MRNVLYIGVVLVSCGAVLAGCTGNTGVQSEQQTVRRQCTRMTLYTGDYQPGQAQEDETTSGALIRLGQAGETAHLGDVAATIVHEYRENLIQMKTGAKAWPFDKNAGETHRQFVRWVKAKFGSEEPWKRGNEPAMLSDVYQWIVAHRADIPASKLLDDELKKVQALR